MGGGKAPDALWLRSVTGSTYQKNIRIPLCNPNATESMINVCLEIVGSTLPVDVKVAGFTTPKTAPSAIESRSNDVTSVATAAGIIISIAHEYGAFLIACYSDNVLTRMRRREFSQPIVGIMGASLFASRALVSRFGVVATSLRSKYTLEDSIRNCGLDKFCANVRHCDLGFLKLDSKLGKEVFGIMGEVGKKLVEDGADILTLGCAGMANMKVAIKKVVGRDVQVIDGVGAGVHHLIGLCIMGTKKTKRGAYMSSKISRECLWIRLAVN